MAKRDPHPQAAAVAEDPEKYASTEWVFAMALVKHKGNASAAAKDVFNVGKKGAKDPANSAESMGSRMLRNVKVQEYRMELLRERFDVDGAIDTVHEVMNSKKAMPYTRADVAFKILEATNVIKKGENQSQAPIVQLVMPSPPPPKE